MDQQLERMEALIERLERAVGRIYQVWPEAQPRIADAPRAPACIPGPDVLGEWLMRACLKEDGSRLPCADLYRAFRADMERIGEYPISQKRFVQRLMDRGYRKIKSGIRYIEGLRWRVEPTRADPYI